MIVLPVLLGYWSCSSTPFQYSTGCYLHLISSFDIFDIKLLFAHQCMQCAVLQAADWTTAFYGLTQMVIPFLLLPIYHFLLAYAMPDPHFKPIWKPRYQREVGNPYPPVFFFFFSIQTPRHPLNLVDQCFTLGLVVCPSTCATPIGSWSFGSNSFWVILRITVHLRSSFHVHALSAVKIRLG